MQATMKWILEAEYWRRIAVWRYRKHDRKYHERKKKEEEEEEEEEEEKKQMRRRQCEFPNFSLIADLSSQPS
jgi:hypothetical protein